MIDELMYGITPSAKIVTFDRLPSGEHVVEPEHRVLRLVGEQQERVLVHARRRDVVADPVHAQQSPA